MTDDTIIYTYVKGKRMSNRDRYKGYYNGLGKLVSSANFAQAALPERLGNDTMTRHWCQGGGGGRGGGWEPGDRDPTTRRNAERLAPKPSKGTKTEGQGDIVAAG